MTQILPRFQRRQQAIEDAAAVDAATRESVDRSPVSGATAGGDERKLRGIPAIARGVTGAINGTRPGVFR